MASQTAATKSKDASSPIKVDKEPQHIIDRANDTVARRAYALFLADGSTDGQDLMHWLQAESEILTRIPDIRESSSWYTVNVLLPGFAVEQIHVRLDDNRLIIAADKAASPDEKARHEASQESVYLVANWPSAVDPATASAYLKDESLTLTVKRANASS